LKPGSCAIVLALTPLIAQDFVLLPASSVRVTDGETGVPREVMVGPFLISRTEVTQQEFAGVTGYNPSFYKGARRPVENVSWWEAIRYANQRSLKEGLEPCYDLETGRWERRCNGYRLPTDEEWSRAAVNSAPEAAHLGTSDTKSTRQLIERAQTGTRDVGMGAANPQGLHDMLGNVWEWTGDYFNPAANTPRQDGRGLARILRGGSFLSTRSGWARGYRSSMEPEHRSRYTGFRVCRNADAAALTPREDATWYAPYNAPPAGFETATGSLSALTAPEDDARSFERKQNALRLKWQRILGAPAIAKPPPRVRVAETLEDPYFSGKLMYLQTEADSWEKILLLSPHDVPRRPLPVVIVPYYDVDTPAGRNLGGRNFLPAGVRSFAYLAVQRGFLAVAIRWFGESYGERYDEAVANLRLRHPQLTGLGKWVWDSQRLLDYLETLAEVDRTRIGIIGHSLGAKMSLYAAAMDRRISAVVFSEGGIGLSFSNYDDYWYLGETIRTLEAGTDHHELLGLIAPRPFLLIGGDDADKAESWHYVNAVRAAYRLFGQPERIGFFNHHSGHTPTPEAVWHGFRWLERFLRAE
jgi:dienelactone hydrolase